MPFSTKNKRRIKFNDQSYYWWGLEEYALDMPINIGTRDKKFLVRYQVFPQIDKSYIIVIGPEFPGLEKKKGNWQRFICPDFHKKTHNNDITPNLIRIILEWCFDMDKDLVEIDADGNPV